MEYLGSLRVACRTLTVEKGSDPVEPDDGLPRYFDWEGRPIDLMTWGHMWETFQGRIVQHDQVSDLVEVLTVWHGMDGDDPWRTPPHIFGSVVKHVGNVVMEITTPTKADALAAHAKLVALAREKSDWD